MFPIVVLTGGVSGYVQQAVAYQWFFLIGRSRRPLDPRDDHDASLPPRFDRSRNR
jgi:hypothetical protein